MNRKLLSQINFASYQAEGWWLEQRHNPNVLKTFANSYWYNITKVREAPMDNTAALTGSYSSEAVSGRIAEHAACADLECLSPPGHT